VPEVIFYVEKADVGYVHMNVDVFRYRLMNVLVELHLGKAGVQ
jgi:hypothetical protein